MSQGILRRLFGRAWWEPLHADPESGAARNGEADIWRRIWSVVWVFLVAAVIFWAVWSWIPFGPRVDIGELERRTERLERLHQINHELEKLRQEYQRRQELETVPEPGVSL